MKIRRVLHVNDIASVSTTLVRALNDLGLHAEIVDPPKPFADANYFLKLLGSFKRRRIALGTVRYARAHGFELLHIHFLSSAFWYLGCGIPFVVHAHGSDVRYPWWRLDRHIVNWIICRQAAAVFYSTPDLASIMGKYISTARFLPNPVDTALFNDHHGVAPEERDREIFVFAALNPIKGADRLIEAVRVLKGKHPELQFVAFEQGIFTDRARREGIRLLPKRKRQDLPSFLAKKGLILGQVRLGAIGLSELETFALGRTAICHFKYQDAYDSPPPSIQAETVPEIVEAVERYLADPGCYRETENSARRWVLDHHDYRAIGRRLLAVYDGISLPDSPAEPQRLRAPGAGLRLCVACQNYPSEANPDVMAFTHARNILYKKYGHQVRVLSFTADHPYVWDGIEVVPESHFDSPERTRQEDLFVFHAPNLRNHLRFILRHGRDIRAKVIVAHGHEFIDWCNQAGHPYDYQMNLAMRLKVMVVRLYDRFKIRVWSWYFRRQSGSGLAMIFVSPWLRRNVENCLGLDLASRLNVHEIFNPIHPVFLDRVYDPAAPKIADFVTIRYFDQPKYAVDVVLETARRHPQWTFHIYGRGDFFSHFPPPPNVTVVRKKFVQSELPDLLNGYRAALLPTRWDSQGVLMCEMACFGMPTVVSDLPICRMMVGEFENVSFMDNRNPAISTLPSKTLQHSGVKSKFGPEATVIKELAVFDHTARESRRPTVLVGSRVISHLLALLNTFTDEKRHA